MHNINQPVETYDVWLVCLNTNWAHKLGTSVCVETVVDSAASLHLDMSAALLRRVEDVLVNSQLKLLLQYDQQPCHNTYCPSHAKCNSIYNSIQPREIRTFCPDCWNGMAPGFHLLRLCAGSLGNVHQMRFLKSIYKQYRPSNVQIFVVKLLVQTYY